MGAETSRNDSRRAFCSRSFKLEDEQPVYFSVAQLSQLPYDEILQV